MPTSCPRPRHARRLRELAAVGLLLAVTAGCGQARSDTESVEPVRSQRADPPLAGPSSPFDTHQPAIDRLDPRLLAAVQRAARDAADDGVTLLVNSGWRSRAHQQRLFDEAVAEYGSEEEARRHVATPDTSAHVTGDAVDIGPAEGAAWLGSHGAAYGLCQIFANEAWHFELATTPGHPCPAMMPDGSSRG